MEKNGLQKVVERMFKSQAPSSHVCMIRNLLFASFTHMNWELNDNTMNSIEYFQFTFFHMIIIAMSVGFFSSLLWFFCNLILFDDEFYFSYERSHVTISIKNKYRLFTLAAIKKWQYVWLNLFPRNKRFVFFYSSLH